MQHEDRETRARGLYGRFRLPDVSPQEDYDPNSLESKLEKIDITSRLGVRPALFVQKNLILHRDKEKIAASSSYLRFKDNIQNIIDEFGEPGKSALIQHIANHVAEKCLIAMEDEFSRLDGYLNQFEEVGVNPVSLLPAEVVDPSIADKSDRLDIAAVSICGYFWSAVKGLAEANLIDEKDTEQLVRAFVARIFSLKTVRLEYFKKVINAVEYFFLPDYGEELHDGINDAVPELLESLKHGRKKASLAELRQTGNIDDFLYASRLEKTVLIEDFQNYIDLDKEGVIDHVLHVLTYIINSASSQPTSDDDEQPELPLYTILTLVDVFKLESKMDKIIKSISPPEFMDKLLNGKFKLSMVNSAIELFKLSPAGVTTNNRQRLHQFVLDRLYAYTLRDEQSQDLKALVSFFYEPKEQDLFAGGLYLQALADQHLVQSRQLAALERIKALFGEIEIEQLTSQQPWFKGLCNQFDISTLEEAEEFCWSEKEFIRFLSSTPLLEVRMNKAEREMYQNLFLNLSEAETLLRAGVNLEITFQQQDYMYLFYELTNHVDDWKDPLIKQSFMTGARYFGYKELFQYTLYRDSPKHDVLHEMESIVNLAKASGLPPKLFTAQILNQVYWDKSTYESGFSFHQLNLIARQLPHDFDELIQAAKELQEIDMVQQLATFFETPEMIFASWINLKKFYEFYLLVQDQEVLEALAELKRTGNQKLYQFVEVLMDPDSRADMQATIQFCQDPEGFFNREASHTPIEVQNRKKPSCYTEIPHLDLTAEQLRDGLVDGILDTLQIFPPYKIIFEVPYLQNMPVLSLVEAAKLILGSRRENQAGLAKSSSKLFDRLKKELARANIHITDFLQGKITLDEETAEIVRIVIFDPEIGYQPTWRSIKIEIHLKSDPEGVKSGNGTSNCMPWGDGKQIVYAFNPNTGQLTVQLLVGEKYRTVAEAVQTMDADVGVLVPELIEQMEDVYETHLEDVLPEEVLRVANRHLALDSADMAPNYRDGYSDLIEELLGDFFARYFSVHGEKLQLEDPNHIVVGTSFTDLFKENETLDNTFVPLAPASYSDKTGEKVYDFPVPEARTNLAYRSEVSQPDLERYSEFSDGLWYASGVRNLMTQDSLAVAYLEGKVYRQNPELIQYLHNMENGIIAMNINNQAKNRPNLSYKFVDTAGKTRAYMLAYEGKLEISLPDVLENLPIIYVSDLAADPESTLAGGRLLSTFITNYSRMYLEQGRMMPIYMEAKDDTSYKLLLRNLERKGRELGVHFELREFTEYSEGDALMHPILVIPHRIGDES